MADYLLLLLCSCVVSHTAQSCYIFFSPLLPPVSYTCVLSTIWNRCNNAINSSVKFRRAIFYDVLLSFSRSPCAVCVHATIYSAIDFCVYHAKVHQKQWQSTIRTNKLNERMKKKVTTTTLFRTNVGMVCIASSTSTDIYSHQNIKYKLKKN